jgi:hypothetical protein
MKENSLKKSVFKKISVLTREVFFNYLVLLVKNCMPNKVSISVALGNATKHCLHYIIYTSSGHTYKQKKSLSTYT